MLTEAAIMGKRDELRGLKENIPLFFLFLSLSAPVSDSQSSKISKQPISVWVFLLPSDP